MHCQFGAALYAYMRISTTEFSGEFSHKPEKINTAKKYVNRNKTGGGGFVRGERGSGSVDFPKNHAEEKECLNEQQQQQQ
jgi:hypothetical protein